MAPPRTHYQQISLKIVKKIAKEEIQPEKNIGPVQGTKKNKEQRDPLRAGRPRSLGSDS
jgi:hypothetical protein